MTRAPQRFLEATASHLRRQLWPAVVLVLIVGFAAGIAAVERVLDRPDQIQVANTAGSLAVMLDVSDARVLIGAGPGRSHAADFIGRSTRPWDREIDLLVLPGWDDQHATGALGLLERRDVHGIAVIGLPGDEVIWTMLEREAQAQGVPLRYLDRPHRLHIAEEVTFHFAPASDPDSGAWSRLRYGNILVDIVDSDIASASSPDPRAFNPATGHVVIGLRSYEPPSSAEADLFIMPQPFWSVDFEEFNVKFVSGIDRGERVQLALSEHSLAISLDMVDSQEPRSASERRQHELD